MRVIYINLFHYPVRVHPVTLVISEGQANFSQMTEGLSAPWNHPTKYPMKIMFIIFLQYSPNLQLHPACNADGSELHSDALD